MCEIDKMEKNKITNANQFEKLVEEMEKNPFLAKGFHRGTVANNFKEQWNELSIVLNALGPPRRLGDGWQKVWRDLKFKVKKKIVSNKAECNATGGGIFKQFTLSPLEESVANLLQFQKQVNPEGAVQGVQCQNPANEREDTEAEKSGNIEIDEQELLIGQDLLQSSSGSNNHSEPVKKKSSTPSKKKEKSIPAKNKQELLQKHSNEQAKLLTDISNSLSSVKRTLRDVSNYQKKMLHIEERKIKLLEERNKREEEMHESELKIKRIKIIIKEKELQLLNKNVL